MELGIHMFGDLHYDPTSNTIQETGSRLKELIEEIKLMDEVGLDFFGMGEHHRPDYAVPTPEIVLAAAAVVTKKIKLGSAVSVLSSSDPVKLYQNFAMVDLLSDGRAELTAGRGSFIESFPLFGYDLKDYDSLFEEKLDLLLKINKSPEITWKGKHRAALNQQQVLPRATNNNLAIWIAVGGTPASIERAARLGLPLIIAIIGGSPLQFKPHFEYYKDIYRQAGHPMEKFQVGLHVHGFFSENSSELDEIYYPFYAAQMNRVGSSRGWPPYRRDQYDFSRSKNGAMVAGDANEAIDKILYLQEQFGLTRFAANMDTGAPAHKHMMKSIEVLGTKIAPKVREALKKSE